LDSDRGTKLFWGYFKWQSCGKSCCTPGAGLYQEKENFEKIAEHLGFKKKPKSYADMTRI
jgi:hypothetical protein